MNVLIGPGAFIAVTGASGVGKDTLLDAAHAATGDLVFFPRRAVTRPAGLGEDHLPLTRAEFIKAQERGRFTVCWRAHGLEYGIPVEAEEAVGSGRIVVANVSRGVIEGLRERYEYLVHVSVTVSDDVRARRLRGRARESSTEITERLNRTVPQARCKPDHEIHNDGSVADGAVALIEIIRTAMRTHGESK